MINQDCTSNDNNNNHALDSFLSIKESNSITNNTNSSKEIIIDNYNHDIIPISYLQWIKLKYNSNSIIETDENYEEWKINFQLSSNETNSMKTNKIINITSESNSVIDDDDDDDDVEAILEIDYNYIEKSNETEGDNDDESTNPTLIDLQIDNFCEDEDVVDLDISSNYMPSGITLQNITPLKDMISHMIELEINRNDVTNSIQIDKILPTTTSVNDQIEEIVIDYESGSNEEEDNDFNILNDNENSINTFDINEALEEYKKYSNYHHDLTNKDIILALQSQALNDTTNNNENNILKWKDDVEEFTFVE